MIDQVQLLCSLQLYLPFLQDIQVAHDGCTNQGEFAAILHANGRDFGLEHFSC